MSDSLNNVNINSLKNDIENGKVVPFIGAGISQSAKLKGKDNTPFRSWKTLLIDLSSVIIDRNKKSIVDSLLLFKEDEINYLEIADKIKEYSNQNDYNIKLNELISINYDEIDANTYILARNIWNLNSNLIITTNYDSVLEKACDSKNVQPLYLDNNFKLSQAVSGELTKPTVWNIHGHESNLDSIILTSESYKKLYDNLKDNSQLHTLKTLVTTKSLLFIGFGYEDNISKVIKNILDLYGGYGKNHYMI